MCFKINKINIYFLGQDPEERNKNIDDLKDLLKEYKKALKYE